MIDFSQYFNRLMTVKAQFELARQVYKIPLTQTLHDNVWNIISFSKRRQWKKTDATRFSKYFLDNLKKEINTKNYINTLSRINWHSSDLKDDTSLLFESYLRKFSSANEFIDRINQNEFIIIFSFLEIFIQDIHRQILTDNPSLLGSQKQIELGRLISKGLDKVLEEEREREVRSHDRDSVEKKAKYFKDKLRLQWPDQAKNDYEKSNNIRNSLLHEDPDRIVSTQELKTLHALAYTLPYAIVKQAIVVYPESFKRLEP